jgi:hypothetical protein
MRSAFFLILSLVCISKGLAQCPVFQLSDFQALQRANDAQKESLIRSLGFDLISKTDNSFRYNKCWNRHRNGKEVYDQVLVWNTDSGQMTFLTPDEAGFMAFRKTIEGRHGQTGTLGTSDVYIGQMFVYHFGSRWLDGVMHWSVDISLK